MNEDLAVTITDSQQVVFHAAPVDAKGQPATGEASYWRLDDVPGWSAAAIATLTPAADGLGATLVALNEGKCKVVFGDGRFGQTAIVTITSGPAEQLGLRADPPTEQ